MKVLPDTSVMVLSVLKNHVNHAKVMQWQRRIIAGELTGVLAAHSLAETYSTLTRIPPPDRLSPAVAWNAIERNLQHFDLLTLTEEEARAVVADLAARNIGGGQVYDALIAVVARKAQVDILLTFNADHFLRVAPDLADRIQVP